jgi:hypothetical protein
MNGKNLDLLFDAFLSGGAAGGQAAVDVRLGA